jgi:hypothetical protein
MKSTTFQAICERVQRAGEPRQLEFQLRASLPGVLEISRAAEQFQLVRHHARTLRPQVRGRPLHRVRGILERVRIAIADGRADFRHQLRRVFHENLRDLLQKIHITADPLEQCVAIQNVVGSFGIHVLLIGSARLRLERPAGRRSPSPVNSSIALLSRGLIGVSLVWDKVLLRQPDTRNVVSYVFWLGALSILGLLLIPFGFRVPSQTLAVVGGVRPSPPRSSASSCSTCRSAAKASSPSACSSWAAVLPSVLAASATFGLTNVLEKITYDRTNFVTGYVFFTLGTFAGALCLLVRRDGRRQNRFLSGVGSFLVFYAISRTSPAIVDAVSGVRYAIIFLGAYLLAKLKPAWLSKDFTTQVLVVAGLVLLALGESA